VEPHSSRLKPSCARSRAESEMDAELRFPHRGLHGRPGARRPASREPCGGHARVRGRHRPRQKRKCRDARGVNLRRKPRAGSAFRAADAAQEPRASPVGRGLSGAWIGPIPRLPDGRWLPPAAVAMTDPGRLVAIETSWPIEHVTDRLRSRLRDIARDRRLSSAVVAYGVRGGFVSGQGQGLETSVEVVSENYFATLALVPCWAASSRPNRGGRRQRRSVVVSHSLWQSYFGGDPSLPGKTASLDGQQFTVIGSPRATFAGCGGWSPWHLGHHRRLGHHGFRVKNALTPSAINAG